MKKLALVQSPIDEGIGKSPYARVIPPLGLLSLATYVRSPGLDIRIIDGNLYDVETAKKQLATYRPDFVGVAITSCEAHNSGIELARFSHDLGARVILGGEHAASRARQIIANRPFIEAVADSQGEIPLLGFVSGEDLARIPGLVHKNGANPLERRLRLHNGELPIPDRTFVDLEEYGRRFRESAEHKFNPANNYGSAKTQNGCLKAAKFGPCTFCSRTDLADLDLRTPEMFWQEMTGLESLGIDYVWEASPSFSWPNFSYLDKLAKTRPTDSKMKFRMYVRADEICDERKVDALKRIGIENALIGFESGNQECLDGSNKRTTPEQNVQAVKNLKKYGISLCSAFIIGHQRETQQSMQDTLNHARALKEILGEKLYRVTTVSTLQPYPGSVEFDLCTERFPELRAEAEKDNVDLNLFSQRYFADILHLDIDEANSIVRQIRDLCPIGAGKGVVPIKYGDEK